jgi:1,4-alpha-glucan branching enzyme
MQRLLEMRHHDPFTILGRHWVADNHWRVRALLPGAVSAAIEGPSLPMQRIGNSDLFEWIGADIIPQHYLIRWEDHQGDCHYRCDPYSFAPQLSDMDMHLFAEGSHQHIYRKLGSHLHRIDHVNGVLFAVWAPNAQRISVVGDHNNWDGRINSMRCRGSSGIWELFVPGLGIDARYKYEIRHANSDIISLKADPYAQRSELRPRTASIVNGESRFGWSDQLWMEHRNRWDWQHAPLSVYELHVGSWRRAEDGGFINWKTLAHSLIPYVKELGFTHIELMPIAEHPLDESWGYQCTGYFAPSSRFGSADELRYFIDCAHRYNLGIIVDWVAGHFPKDQHGLAQFDGSALYEHGDPLLAEHPDWGTLTFNFGRNEVKNFLFANALYWFREFHIDGLRVDAVASMIYLDYSLKAGEWVPNQYGGNENLEAIAFLRELNEVVHQQFPGAIMIAEESTSWPQVSRPTWVGGLGFSMKWNMGWMHDSLMYMQKDPIHRGYHHELLTFSALYAHHENFMLPLSHDEVVHGKRSLLEKMSGDDWQKFANLRLLYLFLYTWPGKKLLFMGAEFAQRDEWDCQKPLDWQLLGVDRHSGVTRLVTDLNYLYRRHQALYYYDFEPQGFQWIECHDGQQSVLSYQRKSDSELIIVVLNFTPEPRYDYRIGVPEEGIYRELINSDSEFYAGSNMGNNGLVHSEAKAWMGQPHSLALILPPLAGIVLTKLNGDAL